MEKIHTEIFRLKINIYTTDLISYSSGLLSLLFPHSFLLHLLFWPFNSSTTISANYVSKSTEHVSQLTYLIWTLFTVEQASEQVVEDRHIHHPPVKTSFHPVQTNTAFYPHHHYQSSIRNILSSRYLRLLSVCTRLPAAKKQKQQVLLFPCNQVQIQIILST